MPPPRAVLCPICGGKYFKASLPVHMKACKKKYDATHSACKKCGMMVENSDWQNHRSFCKDLPRRKGQKPGESVGMPVIIGNDVEYISDDLLKKKHDPSMAQAVDPRVACKFCTRKFNPDRINKHMMICNKIKKNKNKRKIWNGAKKRIEGTDFAEFENNRSGTPELVKEWKANGRRWRKEREQFRDVMGAEEDTGGQGVIASLQAPAIPVQQVGVNVPSTSNIAMLKKGKTIVNKRKKLQGSEAGTPALPDGIVKESRKEFDKKRLIAEKKTTKDKKKTRNNAILNRRMENLNLKPRKSLTSSSKSKTEQRKRASIASTAAGKVAGKASSAGVAKRGADLGTGAPSTKLAGKARNMEEYRKREAIRRAKRNKGRR